jgi:hypothetical protein
VNRCSNISAKCSRPASKCDFGLCGLFAPHVEVVPTLRRILESPSPEDVGCNVRLNVGTPLTYCDVLAVGNSQQ